MRLGLPVPPKKDGSIFPLAPAISTPTLAAIALNLLALYASVASRLPSTALASIDYTCVKMPEMPVTFCSKTSQNSSFTCSGEHSVGA